MAQQHLKILTDVNIPHAVFEQLCLCGVDSEKLIDVLLEHSKAPDILQFAYDNGYTIVTRDKRIWSQVNSRIANGKQHLGVFIVPESLQGPDGIGRIVEALALWHEAITVGSANLQNEIYNQVRWIK
jgi:Domain of unknown function (DUF5615)